MYSWKNRLVQATLFTLIAINLMLAAMIIGQKYWLLPMARTVSTSMISDRPQLTSKYTMQFIAVDEFRDVHRKGGKWRVEHYREYEYRYNSAGQLINRQPTSKEEHIRYWISDSSHES